MFGYPSSRIQQIIFSSTLIKPRSFFIQIFILHSLFRLLRPSESLHRLFHFNYIPTIRNHVLIHFHIKKAGVTPIYISLSVVVNENGRVDISPSAGNHRLSECILKRTGRTIGNSNSDSIYIRLRICATHIPVEFAIPFYTLSSPCGSGFRPRKSSQGKLSSMISPVHHVSRRIDSPLIHIVIIRPFIPVDIYIKPVSINHRSRIRSITGLHNRILRISCNGR